MARKKKKTDKQKNPDDDIIQRFKRTDLSGSFTNPAVLSKHTKHKRDTIKEALKDEPSYYLHRSAKYKFPRRQVIVSGPNVQLQIDLKDVKKYQEHNDKIKYLLCAVDCFSKMAYVRPMTNKNATSSEIALTSILKDIPSNIKKIQCDRGGEFWNQKYKKFLSEHKIKLFATHNYDIKASHVERFQRTLMRRIHKFFTAFNTWRYVDDLQKIVYSYNRTFHASIGMAPINVSPANAGEVAHRLFSPDSRRRKSARDALTLRKYKFAKGDSVVITKLKKLFQKEYLGLWKPEIYFVDTVNITHPPTYKLRDYCGEVLEGSFYEQEMQSVKVPLYFKIDEILKTKKDRRGKKLFFVKWLYYPGESTLGFPHLCTLFLS